MNEKQEAPPVVSYEGYGRSYAILALLFATLIGLFFRYPFGTLITLVCLAIAGALLLFMINRWVSGSKADSTAPVAPEKSGGGT